MLQQFVTFRANAGNTDVPKIGQRTGESVRDQSAHLPLEPDGMPPDPFRITVCRNVSKRAIDQSGKRLYRLSIAACTHEHERKIIAKRGEIPVSGEHCGVQIALGAGIEPALGRPTRRWNAMCA